jgi:uncharacterized protein (DUF302 family)
MADRGFFSYSPAGRNVHTVGDWRLLVPVVKRSRHSFPETTRLLTEGIERAGSTVFVTIDQTEAARGVGLDLRPTCLIVFGNPRAGTPLMDAVPLAALALPLKLLVWENADAVDVAYVSVSEPTTRE